MGHGSDPLALGATQDRLHGAHLKLRVNDGT
jgi:hypothetical protein